MARTLSEIANSGEGMSIAYITTATTTQVKTGAGFLDKIVINKPIASGTIKLIDGVAGTTENIAKITHEAGAVAKTLVYGIPFTTGLRIVTSGADDLTVVYR